MAQPTGFCVRLATWGGFRKRRNSSSPRHGGFKKQPAMQFERQRGATDDDNRIGTSRQPNGRLGRWAAQEGGGTRVTNMKNTRAHI
jgi:hypothetical protein